MNPELVKCKRCGHEFTSTAIKPVCSKCYYEEVHYISVLERKANAEAKALADKWSGHVFAALEARCFEGLIKEEKCTCGKGEK